MAVQNVGTETGSGHCAMHYDGTPNANGRDDAILIVAVKDLGPGKIDRIERSRPADASPRERPSPVCDPGVHSP